MKPAPPPLTILGGGPAGLSVAYYARQRGIPFTVCEASPQCGGNCVTFQHGDFRYDSGAHRFHDVHPEVTADIRRLLGEQLQPVLAPSQIYLAGRRIDFPLAPWDLARKLGGGTLLRGARDFLRARLRRGPTTGSFEAVVSSRYGRTLAELFLLPYSEKLWGIPGHRLSMAVAGRRLQGLDLRTFLVEMAHGAAGRTRHLDGAFYYPESGYGSIVQTLAAAAGLEHLRTGAAVTRLRHANRRLTEVEINHATRLPADEVVSTLPLNRLLELLDPPPPASVQEQGCRLQFRHLILVALFLDQPTVTSNASVYFPEAHIPFNRVFEPRNRSRRMSPPGKTSLVAELTCSAEDERWHRSDEELCQSIVATLEPLGWLKTGALRGTEVRRIHCAYPVLELGFENILRRVCDYLASFENLRLTGRNSLFAYSHLHDQMKAGRELIDQYAARYPGKS